MKVNPDVTRRSFVVGLTATAGSLSICFAIPLETRAGDDLGCEITAWIVINRDNSTVIRVAKSEMGQGVLTALPMLVAEELECAWTKVKTEYVPAHENLIRGRAWGDMSTGASRSVRASEQELRRAGATARHMLIGAAAAKWSVPCAECHARDGIITHEPTGRTVTFGEIAAAAAQIKPPRNVELKSPQSWKLIGTPQRRLDVAGKVTGEAVYGIDVRLPDMLYAAVRQSPVLKGKLQSVDRTKLIRRKGVRHVVELEDSVAVVAENWWVAKQALADLDVIWHDGENASLSNEDIAQLLLNGLTRQGAGAGRTQGDFDTTFARAHRQIEADYIVPFLAHVTMEPQNATAYVHDNQVDVWAPTQNAEGTMAAAANAAGVRISNVLVHQTAVGGGFGRRDFTQDFVSLAVRIAKHVPHPVKVIWTREEDIQHDFYRPMVASRMRAGLDEDGYPVAWHVRLSGPSLLDVMSLARVDKHIQQGFLEDMPYDIANYRVDHAPCKIPVPVGPWRGMHHSQNCFFKECFIDELAHAAQEDPYLYLLGLLRGHPQADRLVATLNAAATRAGWGSQLPSDIHRGIAMHETHGTYTAAVVEASVRGQLRVHRVVTAIDCGTAVNPLTIQMQVESATVWALSAAIYGEITYQQGRVQQSNFDDYPVLRLSETPIIETVVVPGGGAFSGVGEPPVVAVAPALCNAIFAATGKRIRSLPLKNQSFHV